MKRIARSCLVCLLAALMVLAVLPATIAFAAEETTVTLSPGYVEIWIGFGEECRLAATVTGADPDQALRYASSDPTVATVSDDGNIVPVSVGQTYITATATDGSGAVSNAVLVNVLPEVVTPDDQLITLGAASSSRINKDEFLAWPQNYGEAHIALWYGGAMGAVTITIDDNISGDFPRWNHYLETYGIPVTFFVPTEGGGKSGEIWENQVALGQAIQSHTLTHPSSGEYEGMTTAEIWMDFYRSVGDIELYTPSASKVIAYSYGYNNAPYSSKIFIAGRGTAGHSNPPDTINYNYLNSFSCGKDTDFESYVKSLYDTSYTVWGKTCIGNWNCMHFHGITGDNDSSNLAKMMSVYLPQAIAAKNVWAGLFEEVAMYGQERDTATLTVHSVDGDSVVLSVTDMMSDRLYDFPLTVKVRVDDTWKHAYATQGGKRVGVEIYERDGATYLLVDAVPDRGAVVVSRTDTEMPEVEAAPSYAPTFGLGNHNMSAVRDGAATPAEGDVITISSVADWEAFSDYVAAGNTGAGLTFVLTTDLDLSSIDFYTPIGRSSAPFGGTFDGRGHTLTVDIERGTDRVGPFGNIVGATVRSLHVTGNVKGRAMVGGIVGAASGSTVEGCTFRGTVSSSGGAARGNNVESLVGGIVGSASTSTIDRCISYASVTAQKPYAGGIVSTGSNLTVTNCASYATVVGTSYVGSVMGDTTSTSSGNAITLRNNLAAGSVTGSDRVGGLSGAIGNMNGVKVHNNLVTATVTCTDPAGLVGIVTATVTRGGNNVNPTHAYSVGARYGDMPAYTLVGDCTAKFFSITEEQLAGTSDALIHETDTYAAKSSVLEALNAYAEANGYRAWSYAEDGTPVPVTLSATDEAGSAACPHTVVFVGTDGAVLATETVSCGSAATPPALPAGATGWSVDTSAVFCDTVVYALEVPAYAVTFRGFDGQILKNEYVYSGTSADAPEAPEVPSYHFCGWSADFSSVTAPLSVRAEYRLNEYTVTFLGKDGQVLKTESVPHGTAATPPTAPALDRFDFDGWSADTSSVTSDMTVRALYTERFTVTFLDADGTVLATESVRCGEDATAPAMADRAGLIFLGWSASFTDVTADVTVKALYDVAYQVTFLGKDGELLWAGPVAQNTAAVAPAVPQYAGFLFDGWSCDFSRVTSELTVRAEYTVAYTVTYLGKDGQVLKEETVRTGTASVPPAAPELQYFAFMGWSADTSSVTSDMTVYAEYAISCFSKGSGTESDPYLISSKDQLEGLSAVVAGGDSLAGVYFRLVADIVLNEGTLEGNVWSGETVQWTPIGTDATPFSGYFDGCGHTVSGIYIKADISLVHAGLFGKLDGATVKNLTLAEGYISAKVTRGAFAGYAVNSTLENLHNRSVYLCGDKARDYNKDFEVCAGGIVGYAYGTTLIENCTVDADVLGNNSSNSSGSGSLQAYVGGIVGYAVGSSATDRVTVRDCLFTATATVMNGHGSQVVSVGGTVGKSMHTAVIGCASTGKVVAQAAGSAYVGGTVGLCEYSTVLSSYSTATLDSTPNGKACFVGGTVGHANVSTVENCYFVGEYLTREDCTRGAVAGSANGTNSYIRSCYYVGDLPVVGNAKGTLADNRAVSAAELADSTLLSLLCAYENASYDLPLWYQGATSPVLYAARAREELRFGAASLVLSDSIHLYLYIKKSDLVSPSDLAVLADGVSLVYAGEVEQGGVTYLCFIYTDLAAADMGARLSLTLSATGAGVCDTLSYGVVDYATRMYGKADSSDQLRDLLVAMMYYGDAAALSKYGTSTLLADFAAASGYTASDTYVEDTYATLTLTPAAAGCDLVSSVALVLTDFVRPVLTLDSRVAEVRVSIYGKTYVYATSDGEAVIDCLTSTSLSVPMSILFYDGEGTLLGGTTYAVSNYVLSAVENLTGAPRELAMALAVYMQSVRSYNGLE